MIQEKATWGRVTKKDRCPICNSDNWCTLASNGHACCMRIQSNVPMKNGGWLHKAGNNISFPPLQKINVPEAPKINCFSIWKKWSDSTKAKMLMQLGEVLGINALALHLIGCAWAPEHNAWAFPMKDSIGCITGIRFRGNDGKKWSLTGSKAGLFIPKMDFKETVFVTEGATDTAALLSLGFCTIGRPSCLGQEDLVMDTLKINKARRVVIVPDNDEPKENGRRPGIEGAYKLKEKMLVPSLIFTPPTKDIREFIRAGADAPTIESIIKNLVWNLS